ncbi:NlpC/P60 family protein [Nocardioides sp. dk4132]|uniref:C40 family peptidase n=1 Tax=unclassified Nocardioides TaxID=2615069 RepID=UPI001294F7FB|nr:MULTISPECIES: C40 family peptidase [unclassified Nocardioides]MQW74824.1 NlpC/P60 family protein [Nocardioides sp. dk4132]QGA06714.1 NlpC/P60 family protein [Nocardioides sp. dk884]
MHSTTPTTVEPRRVTGPLRHAVRLGARVVGAGALAVTLIGVSPTPPADAAPGATLQAVAPAAQPTAKPAARKKQERRIGKAISIARNQIGDRYRYGATGPNAFDCSGLTSYAFRKAGIKGIPRTSSAQAGWAKRIARSKMRRGDLVFFHNGGSVYHVGIFTGVKDGKRRIIHAPSTGKRVQAAKIWTDSWFAGTARR